MAEPAGTGAHATPSAPATRPPGKVIVVMPAMNAAATLPATVANIPRDWVDEVILVDDHSTDDTVQVARTLPVHVLWHPHNAGYGANQKTCYIEALQRGADAIVMLHPDGQYPPELIPTMVEPILAGRADLVLGSRLAVPGMARANGMPMWKYIANRFLTGVENRVMGTRLTEAHTGFRAYSRHMLLTIPFLRNSLDFVFDSEVILQASHFGLRIEEVPAPCRYFEGMSSVGVRVSIVYGLKTLWACSRLILHRLRVWRSAKFSRPGRGETGGVGVLLASGSVDLPRAIAPGSLAIDEAVVTNMLFERLSEADVAEIERRIDEHGGFAGVSGPDEDTRRFLLLALGMHLGVSEVAQRTGLRPEFPPEEAHAMARGPLAAAGGLYEADMVVAALRSAGVELSAIHAGLDFGCSSGRVARVLATAFPDISWQGCDPNRPAIEWAQANLPGIKFFVNGNEPPLPLGDGDLDLVYAISIWSHFEPRLGLQWFEEMRRILAPGAYLVFTTHGLTSIDHYLQTGQRSQAQSLEIERALYSNGAWYASEFGEQGDWGVINPSWGTAFLSPEWVLMHLCPSWRVVEFSPGRNQQNQDVYVLQRV